MLVLIRVYFAIAEVSQQGGCCTVLESPFPQESLTTHQPLECVSKFAIGGVDKRVKATVYPAQPENCLENTVAYAMRAEWKYAIDYKEWQPTTDEYAQDGA